MSAVLESVYLAVAVTYLYTGASSTMLYALRPVERESLTYGIAAFAMAVHVVGCAIIVGASSPSEAMLGEQLQLLGVLAGSVAFLHLIRELSPTAIDTAAGRVLFGLCHVFSGVGIAMTLAGLAYDPGTPAGPPALTVWHVPYHLAALTPIGAVISCVALAMVGATIALVIPEARNNRDLRTLAGWTSLAVVALAHDVGIGLGWLRSIHLVPFVGLSTFLAAAYVVLGRIVRTREELARRTLELRRSTQELEHAEDELVRAEQNAAVGELSAVIAHELQTPLSAVRTALGGLRAPAVAEGDAAALLGILDQEADRLNRLVQDLLAYARPPAPQWRVLALAEVVEKAMVLARRSTGRSEHVQLQTSLGAVLPIRGDPEMLAHALQNVLTNAIEAMPAGGTIEVFAEDARLEDRRAIALVVQDTGEGMDTLVRSRAREPFFTTRASGTGLGLAIVERAVRAHGGQLAIESDREEGTTVRIILPVARISSVPPE